MSDLVQICKTIFAPITCGVEDKWDQSHERMILTIFPARLRGANFALLFSKRENPNHRVVFWQGQNPLEIIPPQRRVSCKAFVQASLTLYVMRVIECSAGPLYKLSSNPNQVNSLLILISPWRVTAYLPT